MECIICCLQYLGLNTHLDKHWVSVRVLTWASGLKGMIESDGIENSPATMDQSQGLCCINRSFRFSSGVDKEQKASWDSPSNPVEVRWVVLGEPQHSMEVVWVSWPSVGKLNPDHSSERTESYLSQNIVGSQLGLQIQNKIMKTQ